MNRKQHRVEPMVAGAVADRNRPGIYVDARMTVQRLPATFAEYLILAFSCQSLIPIFNLPSEIIYFLDYDSNFMTHQTV